MAEFEVTLTTDDVVASDALSILQDKGISDSATLSDFLRMEFYDGTLEPSFSDLIASEEVSVEDALGLVFSKSPTDLISVTDQLVAKLINSLMIDDARALNETTIRIDFDRAVIDNEALRDPASYTFLPVTPGAAPIVPMSVTIPVSQVNPLFVTVEVTEQTDAATYSIALTGAIQGVNGEPPDQTPFNFTGIGVAPEIALVLAIDQNTVEVQFTETMLDNDSIRDLSKYSFDNGLVIKSIESVIGNVVTLKTSDQIPGQLYTLTILGADLSSASLTDLISVTDQVVALKIIDNPDIAESINVVDQVAREVEAERALSDSISVSDSVTADTGILPNQVVYGSGEDAVVIGSGEEIVIAGS